VKWLPSWLGEVYSTLYSEFGDRKFSLDDAVHALNHPRDYVKVALSQLCKLGWCVRESKGVYSLLKPLECILTLTGVMKGIDKVPCREYVPLLRRVIAELYELLQSNLLAVILFGSIARGDAKSNSDVDLLVIASNLPKSYLKRAAMLTQVVVKTRSLRVKLWSKNIYTSLQILAYTPEEMKRFHSFYFDLAFDGILLYSRGGYGEKLLSEIRRRIEAMGVKRVYTSGGNWYWTVK